jgi:hypothetical protein
MVSGLAVLVGILAGLLAMVGAVVGVVLVAGAVYAGLATTGRLAWIWLRAVVRGRGGARVAGDAVDGVGLGEASDHALLARQTWWRLRC